MKFWAIGIFWCFALSESLAQSSLKRFYDEEGDETDSARSNYYEVLITDEGSMMKVISYFTKSNKLRIRNGTSAGNGEHLRTYYYPNGSIKSEGHFNKEVPKGIFNSYYLNGGRQAELLFEEYKGEIPKPGIMGIINYWDSLGNVVVENGKGTCQYCNLTPLSDDRLLEKGQVVEGFKQGEWEGTSENHHYNFKESYDRGILVRGIQYCGGDEFKYTELATEALPKVGTKSFYKEVAKAIHYPLTVRRKGIQGSVLVEFVVDKDGSLTHVTAVKGIDEECDEEAVKAVASLPAWTPRTSRGKPIKQRITLPIEFKIQ